MAISNLYFALDTFSSSYFVAKQATDTSPQPTLAHLVTHHCTPLLKPFLPPSLALSHIKYLFIRLNQLN